MDFKIGTRGISYPMQSTQTQNKRVERKTFQGSMDEVLKSQETKEPQDSIEFSQDSDYKKLENVKKLNEITDFSGMTDLEKFTIIQERYYEAFPDFKARMNIGAGIRVNADMQKQYDDDLKKVGITDSEVGKLYQAYKGYDNMTDEQKWESIQNEYGNPKNGIEQICALTEMSQAKLVDWDTVGRIIDRVLYESKYAASEEKGYDFVIDYYHTYRHNSFYQEKLAAEMPYEYLQNHKIDFESIATNLKQAVTYDTPEKQQEFHFEVDYITDLMKELDKNIDKEIDDKRIHNKEIDDKKIEKRFNVLY